MGVQRDPGSFRDPSGYVYLDGGTVWRTVNACAESAYQALSDSGLIRELCDRGLLIDTVEEPAPALDLQRFAGARGEVPKRLLRHPRVPMISYPYEWTFSQLKDAALAHLDLQIAAFDKGFALSDATPYNMQFLGTKVVHIDVLSLRPYREGEIFAGHNQFCRLFLLPLLLEAWQGMPFQPLLRGRIEGIQPTDAINLLPAMKRWLSLRGLLHVTLPARLEKAGSSSRHGEVGKLPTLPKARYRAILTDLRAWVAELRSGRKVPTFWKEYAGANSYSDTMQTVKRQFVADFVAASKPETVWDVGGNTGDYSEVALKTGAKRAVVLDTDLDCLEMAYARRKRDGLDLLPLLLDFADPSPSMGWNQSERLGLKERMNADGVVALAVIHHLAIGRNLPLQSVVNTLVKAGSSGIIEFVPKADPMVRGMLSHREDVFHDYDEEHFRQYLAEAGARIVKEHRFEENGRLLAFFERAP
ncbi:MAG: class I SAM-dependent methyltransferase [Solirubrobacterales bacterium]